MKTLLLVIGGIFASLFHHTAAPVPLVVAQQPTPVIVQTPQVAAPILQPVSKDIPKKTVKVPAAPVPTPSAPILVQQPQPIVPAPLTQEQINAQIAANEAAQAQASRDNTFVCDLTVQEPCYQQQADANNKEQQEKNNENSIAEYPTQYAQVRTLESQIKQYQNELNSYNCGDIPPPGACAIGQAAEDCHVQISQCTIAQQAYDDAEQRLTALESSIPNYTADN